MVMRVAEILSSGTGRYLEITEICLQSPAQPVTLSCHSFGPVWETKSHLDGEVAGRAFIFGARSYCVDMEPLSVEAVCLSIGGWQH